MLSLNMAYCLMKYIVVYIIYYLGNKYCPPFVQESCATLIGENSTIEE